MSNFSEGLLWYLAFLFSTVVHEASHAFTAMKLGDRTAYEGGQVSLDPIAHIRREPVGTVVVPIISFLAGGWMIGWASAPYDPLWARTYPERSAIMALAGPVGNLLIVVAVALIIHAGIELDLFYRPDSIDFSHIVGASHDGALVGLSSFLSILFSLNVLLFAFNLMPFPPLDGSGAVPLLLSKKRALAYMDFIHGNHLAFLGILLAWKAFDSIFSPVLLFFVNLMYPGCGYH